jgi:DNA polymerase-3 subunit epsilon
VLLLRYKLLNKLLKAELTVSGRLCKLPPQAAANLQALDHLRPRRPALGYDYVVVDLETTGLDLRQDRVVSVGAVRVVEGRVRLGDHFFEMINPGRDIPPEAIKIHGITPTMITQARLADAVFDDFLAYLGRDILVAHYAAFDRHFINLAMLVKYGFFLQNLVLDTVCLAERVVLPSDPYGIRTSKGACSLEALVSRFGLPQPDRHTSLGDALTTAMILQIGRAHV